jgi:hypothetical protein
MSASAALRAAEAVGLSIDLDGNDLLLEAASRPSPIVIEALSRNKSAVVELLRHGGAQPPRPTRQHEDRDLPVEWAEGLAILSLRSAPEGFTTKAWRQLVDDACVFVGDWAVLAAQLGWGSLDVFGVHVRAPAARYDGMGLVPLIRGGEIVALTRHRATIRMRGGAELIYLKRPLQDAVPIWAVARAVSQGAVR